MSDYKIICAADGLFNIIIDGRQTYRTDTIDDAYYNMYLMQQAEEMNRLNSLQLELDLVWWLNTIQF